MSATAFYDTLTPYYHLIYPDWQGSIARQGAALDSIIRSEGGPQLRTVLDAACGIGTQSLGLATLGYEITASDISSASVARAQEEAGLRGLHMRSSVADMRHVFDHHRGILPDARRPFRKNREGGQRRPIWSSAPYRSP